MSCVKVTPRRGPCKDHGVIAYSAEWDTYYCPVSLKWLEPECDCDPADCEFRGRPELADKAEGGTK